MRINAGKLGKIPRHQWEHLLFSNRGAFERFPRTKYLSRVLGPTLTPKGTITGDDGGMESWVIESLLPQRPADYSFYQQLKKHDRTAATEYAFVVTGIYDIWRKDVRWLLLVLHYLKKEEEALLREKGLLLKEEKRILSETEKISAKVRIPESMRKHLPQYFPHLRTDFSSFDEMLSAIESEVKKIDSEAKFLEDYLSNLKKKIPILFKDLVLE
ncbi:hypothetical protein D6764_00870 [Candidatus Woesearchaeota archaeon]|nr:MAG: hypothetical protein D6764_00870 [Candidatus Woesearchaeota archaeon]